MVHCVIEYNNDPISTTYNKEPYYSTAENMYEALEDEGHDARLYIFSPSDDVTEDGKPTIAGIDTIHAVWLAWVKKIFDGIYR